MRLHSAVKFIWGVLLPLLAIAWGLLYLYTFQGASPEKALPVVPDTVHTKRHYALPKVVPNIQPNRVVEYVKPDSALRDSLERAPIISEVEIRRGHLSISTINPQGIAHTSVFDIPPEYSAEINSVGEVAIHPQKRRWLKRAAIAGGIIVGGIVAYVLIK